MSNVTETTFNHKVAFSFFPSEPLLGINVHNTEVLCYDDEFRPVFSIEFGFLFFTISYSNMNWK